MLWAVNMLNMTEARKPKSQHTITEGFTKHLIKDPLKNIQCLDVNGQFSNNISKDLKTIDANIS
jgi:hypothetical protein